MRRALVISAILTMLAVIASLAVTMGGGTVQGQEATPTPPPECLVAADLDVVIVIDKTGSMLQDASGHTRLYWAKQAALALVDGMAGVSTPESLSPHHVEIITFDGAVPVTIVTPFSNDAVAVRAAINAIANPPSVTDTYIAPALTRATTDLNNHVHGGSHGSYKVVVLLSDGRNYTDGDDTYGTDCPATHGRRTNTVNAIPGLHVAADTVYTISLGDETTCGTSHTQLCAPENCNPSELDHYLLVDIAEGPPGDYTNVEDASTLPDIYGDISQEVINICPPTTATATPTKTSTATPTKTSTATPTKTSTATPTKTATPTNTATATPINTATPTNTNTPTPTNTNTPAPTESPHDGGGGGGGGHTSSPTDTPLPPTATPTQVSTVAPLVITPLPPPAVVIMPATGSGGSDGRTSATIAGGVLSLMALLLLSSGLRLLRRREGPGGREG